MKKIIAKMFGLYTDKQLVSFGNYLLSEKREGLTGYRNRRVVTHADTSNWEYEQQNQ